MGEFGTHERKDTRVETFQCKNPDCEHLKEYKTPKQFVLTTSRRFQELITDKLQKFYEDLMIDGARQKTLAKKYGISEAQVSALRSELEKAIDALNGLDSLVLTPQSDTAIAIDETFLKIEGTAIYVILATGYISRKTLGVKVSKTRSEENIREVFDEADRNTAHRIATLTSDALNATQSMAKNLGREITHVIHPHKKPFKNAIIKHYRYEGNDRITTTIGVNTDFFKKRGKRRFRYLETRTDLTPKVKKKRGRPKGSKKNKNKKLSGPKKKRGRKGLYAVFAKGTIGYATINPYRETVKLKKGLSSTVAAALNETLFVYAVMSIQNNLAENINSFIRVVMRLTGPKTVEFAEQRVRATLKLRNHPELLKELQITRSVRGDFLLNNLKLPECAELVERGILV
jgi:transposase-like protein